MYEIEKGMNQTDKDLMNELSGHIRDHTPQGESDDTTYTVRPEALKIAQLSFDAAVKEIDAAVRQPLIKLASENEVVRYNAGGEWSGMVMDISVEYTNLAIKISRVLDTLDQYDRG